MKRYEAEFVTEWQKWARHNFRKLPPSFAWEAKITTTKTLPFSAVKEHQINALIVAKRGVFIYKISDFDQISQKPCDGVYISGGGFLIIKFIRPGNKEFLMIDIEAFLGWQAMHPKHVSINEADAKWISYLVGETSSVSSLNKSSSLLDEKFPSSAQSS